MILLLHGALGSGSQLVPLAEKLADLDPRIIEFPGHGANANSESRMQNLEWTIQSFAEFLEEIASASTASTASIFGYSMGGYVAMYLSQIRPNLINKIFTLGTKLDWSVEGAAREIEKLSAEKIEMKVPAFANVLKKRHGEENWKNVLEKTAGLMRSLGADPLLTIDNAPTINAKVRLCVGDRDEMVSFEETRNMYTAIPGAEFEVFPNTCHPIEKVNIDLLQQSIRNYFAQQ